MRLEHLDRETHVWFIVPEAIQSSQTLAACLAILSEQERERCRRFRFPKDRHRYLLSHALLRKALSQYAPVAPADWAFSHTSHGKPEISNPGVPAIRFNLTHTDGLAACVVTLSDACGIDAEKVRERHNPLGIAERMFSQPEIEQIRRLSGRNQLEYFFKRWTLREAYVKALGIGISFPTRKLHFKVDNKENIHIELLSGMDGADEDWRFQLLYPTTEHIAAIAVRWSNRADKKIVIRRLEL